MEKRPQKEARLSALLASPGTLVRSARSESGSVIVNFAIAVPVLLAIVAGAIDYGNAVMVRQHLQQAADAGSFAAARELSLSDTKTENVAEIVKAVVSNHLDANRGKRAGKDGLSLSTAVRTEPLEVDVSASQSIRSFFGEAFGLKIGEVKVRSVARIVGRPNICVLGLDPSESGTISLEQDARVTGVDCAVFSNSNHVMSIKSKNSASLSASVICARGGKDGGPGNFNPAPLTDCPSFDDPLSGRPAPTVGACLETDLWLENASRTLSPGTYCGGLRIGRNATVKMQPGTYVMKDGPLNVTENGVLEGDGVAFYLTGGNAAVLFAPDTTISLKAPTSGGLAGLLFFEDRNQVSSVIHKIDSNNARVLLGTLYFPRGELRIEAKNAVASESAYTAIVARAMRLFGGPHLVLNTNYHLTNVPVPEGVKGVGQPVVLVK